MSAKAEPFFPANWAHYAKVAAEAVRASVDAGTDEERMANIAEGQVWATLAVAAAIYESGRDVAQAATHP